MQEHLPDESAKAELLPKSGNQSRLEHLPEESAEENSAP